MHFLYELLEHLLGNREVRDYPVLHRPDRSDVARRTPQHLLCFETDFLDRFLAARTTFLLDGDNRRLVENDTLTSNIDQRIRRTQIDSNIV